MSMQEGAVYKNKKFVVTPSALGHILDETQGHLILRWDAWRSNSHRLNEFGLSSLYCLIALFFLVFFATESFLQHNTVHAQILLFFAILTVLCFVYLRMTSNKRSTNTLVVILLGALCLFLLYTGGVNGTGPLWYYVFPLVALYIQRLWAGIISVIALFILTLILLTYHPAGFSPAIYTPDFLKRFLAVYLAVSLLAFLYAFLRASAELQMNNMNRDFKYIANTDELTGLANRRRMTEVLYQEVARTRRNQSTFSIINFDIDYFKKINDNHGHDAGDAILRAVPDIIHRVLRTQDICSRWGGEEFLVLLPETGLEGATHVAERLRIAFENYRIRHDNTELSVTISLGVFEFKDAISLEDCLKQADKNLYEAKGADRNRVIAG
jgi:diguanylate cyclase (GGDEF)-like protein